MKTELDAQEIEALALALAPRVVDALRPLLAGRGGQKAADEKIFDVKGLAAYLEVSADWIYKNAEVGDLPHFKCGRYLRFKKAEIEKWVEGHSVRP